MCKVVAEIGCNHMGNINIAMQLIEEAKRCNVDYVKFQKRNPEICVPKDLQNKPYNSTNSFGETYLEHRKKLEFSIEQHELLKKHCEIVGVKYACSVWDVPSAKEIISLKPDYIKVPSAMNNNFELIKYIYENFDGDVHISLGMSTYQEREKVIDFTCKNWYRTIFYWTTSSYPSEFSELFLLEISNLHNRMLQVGFSGHHKGIAVDLVAYTLGAQWIERHFTLDRTWKGTDQSASLEPTGIKKLVRDLKAAKDSMKYKKEITENEKINRKKLRND